ncbi:MAG: hypothetical protein RL154_434, partial [Pseudomonadota bacterium]
MHQTEKNSLITQAFIESWIGFMALGAYLTTSFLHANFVISGFFAVVSAVLFMNGFAKTNLFLTAQGPSWWREHKSFGWMHFASEEGELAGIFIGIVFFITILLRDDNNHIHLPIAAALTLVGIMSAAHMAIKNVIPIMSFLEQRFGSHMAL